MEARRESSDGAAGVDAGVGVVGREFAIARTDEVRRMTPPMRERKDLGLGLLIAGIQVPGAGQSVVGDELEWVQAVYYQRRRRKQREPYRLAADT
jgi:hypothetical protein